MIDDLKIFVSLHRLLHMYRELGIFEVSGEVVCGFDRLYIFVLNPSDPPM